MFTRAEMKMSKNGAGAWVVSSIQVKRPGNLVFWISDKPPRVRDGLGLPFGRPFSCNPLRSVPDNNGSTVTMLEFAARSVALWHDSPTEPFDASRTIELRMKVIAAGVETEETLYVDLLCAAMPHAQPTTQGAIVPDAHRPLTSIVQHLAVAAVAGVVALRSRRRSPERP